MSATELANWSNVDDAAVEEARRVIGAVLSSQWALHSPRLRDAVAPEWAAVYAALEAWSGAVHAASDIGRLAVAERAVESLRKSVQSSTWRPPEPELGDPVVYCEMCDWSGTEAQCWNAATNGPVCPNDHLANASSITYGRTG